MCKSDAEGRHNKNLHLKTTQLLFEVVHDVAGGRTSAMCRDCWGKRDQALRNELALSKLRFVQVQKRISSWKNITLEVEVDADRFACGFLYENLRRTSNKRVAQGKSLRDEWNSGCDRLEL